MNWELWAEAVSKAPREPYCGPLWAPASGAGSGWLSLWGQPSKGSSRVAQGVSSVYTRASRPTEKPSAEVSSPELPGSAQCTGAYRINDMEAATCWQHNLNQVTHSHSPQGLLKDWRKLLVRPWTGLTNKRMELAAVMVSIVGYPGSHCICNCEKETLTPAECCGSVSVCPFRLTPDQARLVIKGYGGCSCTCVRRPLIGFDLCCILKDPSTRGSGFI